MNAHVCESVAMIMVNCHNNLQIIIIDYFMIHEVNTAWPHPQLSGSSHHVGGSSR